MLFSVEFHDQIRQNSVLMTRVLTSHTHRRLLLQISILCGISVLWRQVISLQIHWQDWRQSAGTRTISAVIAVIGALKALGDAAGDYSPAARAAPRAQGGEGGGERWVVTTQSSPSESVEVKWQCRLPQALIKKQGIWSLKSICSVQRKIPFKKLSRRNLVVVEWPFFLPTNIYPGLSHDWATFVIH